MIRINLLPVRQTQRRQVVHKQLLGGAAALVITVIICIVWYAKVSSDSQELQSAIQQKQTELANLEKIIGQVTDLQAKKKELEDKQGIIDRLRKGKTGPVRALDDLSSEIPDRVWVTELKEQNSSVVIKGMAIEHEDVSAFMKSLQNSRYFSGVSLGYSKAKQETAKSQGVTLYEFEITCQVNYSA